MEPERKGAVWLASYPKSGNTWLRCLLEANRRNGLLDINDIRISTSDTGATLVQGVSPVPLDLLGFRGEMLVRPAAVLGLLSRMSRPILIKTHFANLQLEGLPPFIPAEFSEKAIYVVRDPRSVFLSFSKFFGMPLQKAAEAMANGEFVIGGTNILARQLISSWSNHVSSWIGEKTYPIKVIRYEDMLEDPAKELTSVLEFLGEKVHAPTVKRAVAATELSKLKAIEVKDGFRENIRKENGDFFNGQTSWQEELGTRWIARIEEDHGKVMRLLGYL